MRYNDYTEYKVNYLLIYEQINYLFANEKRWLTGSILKLIHILWK
jgi:hypothetical protein